MMVKAIKQGAHSLPTPCHSSCCTSFSARHSFFQMFFPVLQFSIMFLVNFLKRSFLDIPITTNIFLVMEFCGTPCSYTLYMCFIFQTRHVLVLYFTFLIAFTRNPDSFSFYTQLWIRSSVYQSILKSRISSSSIFRSRISKKPVSALYL